MKVAQSEVLGWVQKNDPSRTGRSTALYAGEATYEMTRTKRLYRPSRDGCPFCIISQHFVLGYFHRVLSSFASPGAD
jgi:hypothetical protein